MLLALAIAAVLLLRATNEAHRFVLPFGLHIVVLSVGAPLTLFVAFNLWAYMTKGIVETAGGTLAVIQNWALTSGGLILFTSFYWLTTRAIELT